MKILVTGASGTIGTRLCETLLQSGHEVLGVDIKKNEWQPSIDALTTVADVTKENALKDIDPTGIEAVVHLAAYARVHDLVLNPDRALDNMSMLFRTLEWARKNNVPRFVFASSRECYGNIKVEKYTEDQVRVENCESPYTASKIAGEALVESYRRCYGMKTTIIRFSNVYGMYDLSDRVVPLFFRTARANEPITVFGDKKFLDFTYIDDAVQGVKLILEKPEVAAGQTFNLAFSQGTKLLTLAEVMIELIGSKSTISVTQPRVGEIFHYVADITKAKTLLGYDPQTSFDEGIRKSVEWYTKHT